MKNLLSLLLTIWSFASVQGQQLITRSIDLSEDLNVIDIAQFPSGEIILMSRDQLYSYDGYRINELVDLSAVNERLKSMCIVDHEVFLGTNKGRVLKVGHQSLDTIASIEETSIRSMIALENDELLIGTDKSGLHILELKNENELTRIDCGQLDHANALIRSNNTYFIASDQGLFRTTDLRSQCVRVDLVGKKIIDQIIEGQDGGLWIIEFDGTLWHVNLELETMVEVVLDGRPDIHDIVSSQSGLFISSDKGVYRVRLNESGEAFVQLASAESAYAVFVDDEANLWIAGEHTVDYASLYFSQYDLSTKEEIHSMTYKGGELFLGSDSSLFSLNPATEATKWIGNGDNITCLDSYSSLLVTGTYDSGLLIYSDIESPPIILNRNSGLSDNTILAVEIIDAEYILASTLNGLISVKKVGQTWTAEQTMNKAAQYYVLSISGMPDGSIWLGTDKKGAIRYVNGQLELLNQTTAGNETGTMASFAMDGSGNVWAIAEHTGLLRYVDSDLTEIRSPHGSWDMYTSVVALESERLLLIGEKEVSIYNHSTEELIEFGDELRIERGVSFYNNFAIAGSSIFFEHNKVLYRFEDISTARTHSLTNLERVEVDLTAVDTSLHMFKEESNNFQFSYVGILHRNPKRVSYSYRLVGHDDEWRSTSDQQVSYTRLAPGKYQFDLRSSHDLLQSDAPMVSYSFEICRNFYNTVWFRTLAIIALLLIVLWLSRRRRKARELADKMNLLSTESKLLSLKSQLNPHFLFNSFNTVIGLIEEDPHRSVAFVEKLTDFYRGVLEIGDSELIPLSKELEMLKLYIDLLNERFGKGLVVELSEVTDHSFVPPLSLQLLIENAVKHNVVLESDPLVISITQDSQTIQVRNALKKRSSVKDSLGIGLKNLQQRYSILTGEQISVKIKEGHYSVVLPKIFVYNTD